MISRPKTPVVTLLLIAANIIAAFGLLFDPELAFNFGFRADHPSFFAAFSSLFLHANVVHLLGNMVFLAAAGAAVEMAAGSFRFSVVYFVSGLVGVLAHFLFTRNAQDPAPFIGASGCVAGCVAYYSLRYQRLQVSILPKLDVPVIAVTGVWLVLQIVGAFVKLGETSGTSFWAHLGGFLAGLLLIPIFRSPEAAEIRAAHQTLDDMGVRSPGASRSAALRHLDEFPNDPKALTDLAEASAKMGNDETEVRALVKLMDYVSGEKLEEIVERLVRLDQLTTLDAWRRLRLADNFKDTRPELTTKILESIVLQNEEDRRPEAMLALAAFVRTRDMPRSKALLIELAQRYPIDVSTEIARKRGWLA